MVGAKGFEPSTSWSRTRFYARLKFVEFSCSEAIENETVGSTFRTLLKSVETEGSRSHKFIYIIETRYRKLTRKMHQNMGCHSVPQNHIHFPAD